MKGSTIGVAFLLCKTGMTLTEIRQLSPAQFHDLSQEVAYQESVSAHMTAQYVAHVLAAIANTIPRGKGAKAYTASDFLTTEPPQRGVPKAPDAGLAEKAAAAGIMIPGG